uniref:Uncharacterized protein n=1 Tax=Schistosoma curassoni TaxID=6186 RepID=A0A183KB12_9TREM
METSEATVLHTEGFVQGQQKPVLCSFLSYHDTMSCTDHLRSFQSVPASANNARRGILWDDIRRTCPSHRSQCFKMV